MEKTTLTQKQIAQTSGPVNETTPQAVGTATSFLHRRGFLTSQATHLAVVGLSLSVQTDLTEYLRKLAENIHSLILV